MTEHPPESAACAEAVSAFSPLRVQAFRMLWFTWLAANASMWMNDVAAAWLMTSLAPSPLWVALVQSASALPVLVLGLPSGALADILDRRRYFIATQFWVAGIASFTCVAVLAGWMSAPLLLALTFANGIGLTMRRPVFAAIIPEVVPRPQLEQALALNAVAMNGSRIIGPLIAGALIAGAGSQWVFVLNALLSIASGFVIMRWRRDHQESPLGHERLTSAIRVGVQFVRQSARMRGILIRISLFFLHSTAQMALLPLVARALPGGSAGTFTLLLASMGAGAILAALQMPGIRKLLPEDKLVMGGTMLQALSMLAVANSPNIWFAVPAMLVSGMAWISVANSLTVAAQMALPDWVRARGMSIYQMALMGSTAAGAALWGQVATWRSVPESLAIAAVSAVLLMLVAQRLAKDQGVEEDLTPSRAFKAPQVQLEPPPSSRVQVHIEYRIDPARVGEFQALMRDSRRRRMRHGALEWQLLRDIYDPGRFVEVITDETWTEHLRRFDRVTAADVQLRNLKVALHIGEEPPRVTRHLIEQ